MLRALASIAILPHRTCMKMAARFLLILTLGLLACGDSTPAADGPPNAPPNAPIVLAASSLQEALEDVADAWAAQGHLRPVLSFAGSPTIARQIERGAPADIVLLADGQWMDVLDSGNFLAAGTRRPLLGGRLVLIAPAGADNAPVNENLDNLPELLGRRRLAMADPGSVPAGRYGKMAFQSLGIWDDLASRIAPAENVRAALALVERGEAPFGLVYASDLAASVLVQKSADIPGTAQPPIRYPVALLASSAAPEARSFLKFLSSPDAAAIFARYQFIALAD